MNVYTSTVNREYCSGCGMCAAACPTQAIRMEYTKSKEYRPHIDQTLCIDCGLCERICPHAYEKKLHQRDALQKAVDPIAYGIEENSGCFRCRTQQQELLMQSASGGFVTAFAARLLELKLVDCVVHAKRILGKTGEEHYAASVSYMPEALEEGRSSVYGPVCFDAVLQRFAGKKENILFIGTPCTISGAKLLFEKAPQYRGNKLYTVALCCSHNVSGQFVDFLAELHGVPAEERYMANLRAKAAQMENHGAFYTRLYSPQREGDFVMQTCSQFFLPVWRSYCFAMSACNACADFWGKDADVSAKDAWGSVGAADRYGSNIVIFRNRDLMRVFLQMHGLEIMKLSFEQARKCQIPTVQYKQADFAGRFDKDPLRLQGNEGYKKNVWFAEQTKRIYADEGFLRVKAELIDPVLADFHRENKLGKKVRIKQAVKTGLKTCLKFCGLLPLARTAASVYRNASGKMKEFFRYQKKQYHKIIMVGLFNQINAGDEAQIDATVKLVKDRYPEYLVKVLSHVPLYTYKNHYQCVVGPNPRISLWDYDVDASYYYMQSKMQRLRFLFLGYWAAFNAYFVRAGLPTLLLNAKRVAFLEDIKTSDLLYFSGGGGMTGATLSRCWDFMFCMKIARILKVPCVMSGQNSGLWGSKYTERLVRKELGYARAVTLRDPHAVDNLRRIGVEGPHIFEMFDDALFCDKLDDVSACLDDCGIGSTPYIVLHMHYWGIEQSPEEQKRLCRRMGEFCDYMREKTGLAILLVPMASVDARPMEDFIEFYKKDFVKVVRFAEYDFRIIRGLLAKAQICVTMKHHPIIFAVGECVPVLSVSYKPYYIYKNQGALEIFGLGKYSFDLESASWLESFKTLFDEIADRRESLVWEIAARLDTLKERRERFFEIVDGILK